MEKENLIWFKGKIIPHSQALVNDLLSKQKYKTDIAIRLTLFVVGSGSWSALDAPDLLISH